MTKTAKQISATRRRVLKTIGSAIGTSVLGPMVGYSAGKTSTSTTNNTGEPYYYASIATMTEAINNKDISSEELTRLYLDRIAKVNSRLNAVVQLAEGEALAAATKADQMLANGKSLGPLHGIPMTIKDSFDTKGIISTAGTKGRSNYTPSKDATVVSRLKAAGAILLGKTNTPELTLAGETTNLVYGQTNNPYKLSASPGGSSGGAAAIISSGGSAFDIGTDTGGSVRNPAHCCGICGIRPTSGRVPRTGHIISFDWFNQALTTAGPLARYVEDLVRIMPIISGPDGIDPYIYQVSLGDPSQVDLSTLSLAYYTDVGEISPGKEVAGVFEGVLNELGSQVNSSKEIQAAGIEQTLDLFFEIVMADQGFGVNRILQQAGTRETSELLAPLVPAEGDLETPQISPKQFYQVFEKWGAYNSEISQAFMDYDIILCPASSLPAPVQGFEDLPLHTLSYTATYNMTGWPAAVVRAGVSSDGLPIGIQVVGKPWQEHKVLAVAQFIEHTFGGFKPPDNF